MRAQRNRSIRSAVKTKVTKFRRSVSEGAEGVEELVAAAVSALDRAVAKGVLHRNNAARRKSRLMQRLNATQQAAAPVAQPPPAPAPVKAPARGSRAKAPTKR